MKFDNHFDETMQRINTFQKIGFAFWVLSLVGGVALTIAALYIAWHFISKVW